MKALALFSGGLDSSLAIKLILEQGVEVEAINFSMPFNSCIDKVRAVAEKLGISFRVYNISDEYLEIVKSPRYGYGKNLNPCVDCKILMYKRTSELMKELGASFVISGEVLGQRPMSQRKDTLNIIDRESKLKGLILRPLSAKLLPLTIPEEKGWVDRNRLLDIQGRSRKTQFSLAEEYSIHDYFSPSGGCLLTDPGFSQRMKDLMMYNGLSLDDISLLKLGRHFRINPKAKIVVGRNKEENDMLMNLVKPGDICFNPIENKGPIAIGRGEFDKQDIFNASRIVARYCDGYMNGCVEIGNCPWPNGREKVSVRAMKECELQKLRI